MSSAEGSPENAFMGELAAQVEAVNSLAQEITGLNQKPDKLRADGIDLKSLAGRHAVDQLVEMSTVVTEKLGGMVAEIDYDTIVAAPQDLRVKQATWEAGIKAIDDEVALAGIKQERENDQISAILGVPFKAADEMVQRKMQEREAELRANLPSPEEMERLERELAAADKLFALAGTAWPIPTAHWCLKSAKPKQLPAQKPTFTAPAETLTTSDEEPTVSIEDKQTPARSQPLVVPSSFSAPVEPTLPAKLAHRPGRRTAIPTFSSLLADHNVPRPDTHPSIFTFGADPRASQGDASEATPSAEEAQKPLEEASAAVVPATPEIEAQGAEVAAPRSVADSVIHCFESSMGTFFLAEKLAEIVYADKPRPQNADSAIRGHFNLGNGSSHALQERWATAGLILQRGKVIFYPGESHNPHGTRAVHKHVFRLVPAGTKKEGGAQFEGRVVHWDRTYKFGANVTKSSQQADVVELSASAARPVETERLDTTDQSSPAGHTEESKEEQPASDN